MVIERVLDGSAFLWLGNPGPCWRREPPFLQLDQSRQTWIEQSKDLAPLYLAGIG
jgi:hypothetical protein